MSLGEPRSVGLECRVQRTRNCTLAGPQHYVVVTIHLLGFFAAAGFGSTRGLLSVAPYPRQKPGVLVLAMPERTDGCLGLADGTKTPTQ